MHFRGIKVICGNKQLESTPIIQHFPIHFKQEAYVKIKPNYSYFLSFIPATASEEEALLN